MFKKIKLKDFIIIDNANMSNNINVRIINAEYPRFPSARIFHRGLIAPLFF